MRIKRWVPDAVDFGSMRATVDARADAIVAELRKMLDNLSRLAALRFIRV